MTFRFRLQSSLAERPQPAVCPECDGPTDKPGHLCRACQADYDDDRDAAESSEANDA